MATVTRIHAQVIEVEIETTWDGEPAIVTALVTQNNAASEPRMFMISRAGEISPPWDLITHLPNMAAVDEFEKAATAASRGIGAALKAEHGIDLLLAFDAAPMEAYDRLIGEPEDEDARQTGENAGRGDPGAERRAAG